MLTAPRIALAALLLAATEHSVVASPLPESFRCALSADEPFLDQADRFILATLRFQPVEATQAGYHGDAQTPLDTQLDDASPATIAAQRALLVSGKACFATAKAETPEDAADLTLLQSNIDASL